MLQTLNRHCDGGGVALAGNMIILCCAGLVLTGQAPWGIIF
jgi:hypothetical protein